MNTQEREQLTSFLLQLASAKAGPKDNEADTLIREACQRQPDASYLLVQRAMQLTHALQVTQEQAAQLQADLDQARAVTKTSFLADTTAWGKSMPAAPIVTAQTAITAPSSSVMQPRGPATPAAPVAAPSWGSGMLGNVATTAAGVVAGAFLFQGVESLMGHHNQGGALGANAPQPTPVAQNTVVNNYYGDSSQDDADGLTDVADAGSDSDGGSDLA